MLKIFSCINPQVVICGMLVTATSCNTGSNVQEQENAIHSDVPISKVSIAEIESGIKTYIITKEKQGDGSGSKINLRGCTEGKCLRGDPGT